ncbi:MAG: FAD binding domain-containing protein [Ignavibacteria bacterium]|nr:FAD binding domain-containing protein [Ignavibacteria bacterium]
MKNIIHFICNDQEITTELHPATTVLDFVRKNLHLTGTKEGCREGDCGACTVLVGELLDGRVIYKSVNSCLLPVASLHGKHLVTVEGINQKELNPLQHAFVDEGASQCGFCTPGFLMSLTGYFLANDVYSAEEAITSLDGNICRCTGYASIKRSTEKVTAEITMNKNHSSVEKLVELKVLPDYFLGIQKRLTAIPPFINTPTNDVLVSGGTDLFVQQWEKLLSSDVEFLQRDNTESAIRIENDLCFIDARTTISEIKSSASLKKYFPQLANYFQYFGSLPIRNRATVGGNIINASPIGDMTNFLLALDAQVHLNEKDNERVVPLKNFYTGYKQFDKKENEIITSTSFKLPETNSHFNYEKVSKRTFLDIASVNASIYLEEENLQIKNVHLSAGGVAPYPLYLSKTKEFLLKKTISPQLLKQAAEIIEEEISPISDARGSAEYKRLLLRQLFFAHFIKLFPEIISLEEVV